MKLNSGVFGEFVKAKINGKTLFSKNGYDWYLFHQVSCGYMEKPYITIG